MMLYAYLDERRTVKYWKKVAFSILNRMFVNSYILYKQNTAAENPLNRYKFYVQAVEDFSRGLFGRWGGITREEAETWSCNDP